MTISDLYNALEKAIDSGKATLNSTIYIHKEFKDDCAICNKSNGTLIDSDGDMFIF